MSEANFRPEEGVMCEEKLRFAGSAEHTAPVVEHLPGCVVVATHISPDHCINANFFRNAIMRSLGRPEEASVFSWIHKLTGVRMFPIGKTAFGTLYVHLMGPERITEVSEDSKTDDQ